MRYVTFKVKIGIATFFKYDILTQLLNIPNVVPTAPSILVGKLTNTRPCMHSEASELTNSTVSTMSSKPFPLSPPIMRV